MKKIILLHFILIIYQAIYAQTYKDTVEVVSLQEPQKFYLNSGLRSMVGGQSRISVPVILPENTIRWYYTITTVSAKAKEDMDKQEQANKIAKDFKLVEQLTSIIQGAAKTSSNFNPATMAINLAMTPSGGEMCAVYLLDGENNAKFLSKADLAFGSYKYFPEGSREQFNSGHVSINQVISGRWYLGFKNPTSSTGMYVSFEAVALVKRRIKVEISENVKKAVLWGDLGWKEFEKGNYDKCIEYSQKGLTYDSTQSYIHFNMGLCYLMTGKTTDALEEYINAIPLAEKGTNPKFNLQAALKDITDIESNKGKLEGGEDIKELIASSLKKYR